jgi:putative peptidoglycan lipid II flippase
MPLFAPGYSGHQLDLVIALSRLLFPILILLGVTGVVVGILNSYDRFAAFAISPLFWNLAIIAVLVGFIPAFPDGDGIYVYAVGIIAGTVVQLAVPAFDLRRTPFRPLRVFDWRNPLVRRVLLLMLPVSISLGLINFNVLINGLFGTLIHDPVVAERAPAAIDKAFRIFMLPQGIFSVAVATVLFPTLARLAARGDLDSLRATMANGMRQIALLLIPAAAAILVLSEPMVRLVYQRGAFDASQTDLVSTALFWFAFALPFNGVFLLLTRTFFGLQRPWIPTAIAGTNLGLTALIALLLYPRYEVAGIVVATAIATAVSVAVQVVILRRALGGLELGRLLDTVARVTVSAAVLAGVSYLVWKGFDSAFGDALWAQILSVGSGLLAGGAIYAAMVTALRVPEARQIANLVRGRA